MDNELPSEIAPNTDRLTTDPKRPAPCNEQVEPTRRKFRKDNELPKVANENTEICAPKRPAPRMLMEDPITVKSISEAIPPDFRP